MAETKQPTSAEAKTAAKTTAKPTRALPRAVAQPLVETPVIQQPQLALRRALQRAYADPSSLTPRDRQRLQRALGGQRMDDLLAQGHTPQAPGAPTVQAKLTVGPADDHYEQEADRVAGQIMRKLAMPNSSASPAAAQSTQPQTGAQRTPNPPTAQPPTAPMTPVAVTPLQRTLHTHALTATNPATPSAGSDVGNGGDLQVQRAVGLAGGPVDGNIEAGIKQARGGGRPLEHKNRASMESAFNADFSQVRVHTNQKSDTLNRSISAQAFTTGKDIFFKQGAYNPDSSGGQKLLAHELTHVVQQNGSGVKRKPAQASSAPVSDTVPDTVRDTPQITQINRSAHAVALQRLTFDEYSWSGSSLAFWSSYDKGAEQAKITEPFDELETRVNAVARKPDPFTDPEDSAKLKVLQIFVLQTQGKTITWEMKDKLVRDLAKHLEDVTELESAPRAPHKPTASPFLSSLLSGSQAQQSRMNFIVMSSIIAMGMKLRMEETGLDPMVEFGSPKSLTPSVDDLIVGQMSKKISELPPDVTNNSGVTTLAIPGTPALPVLTAELTKPVFDPVGKSSIQVSKVKLQTNPTNAVEIPMALGLAYSKADGFEAVGNLTSPIQVNRFLTIQQLGGEYKNHKLDVSGLARIDLPGVQPFDATVRYQPDDGLVINAGRIDLQIPAIKGVQVHGALTELEYSTKTGFFKGQGQFDADFPVLGVGEASVKIDENKLQRATLDFKSIAYPLLTPVVTGRAGGTADFDEFGKFARGAFDVNLDINLPDAGGENQQAKLIAGATIAEGKFNANLKLNNALQINDYITLNKVELMVVDGELQGGGEFSGNSKLGSKKLPFESGDKQKLPDTPPAEVEKAGDKAKGQLSTALTYGFSWDRGFWVNGVANIPLSPWDNKMLTGVVNYSKTGLSASVEVGDAVIAPRIPFVKPLYAYEKLVMLRGIGKGAKGLGGIYAALQLDLNFYYNFGPLTVDAHATLSNIDLTKLRADLDPLHIEEVRGGLAAELKGKGSAGLGAYALNPRLLNVQGGVELPLVAALQANVISHLGPMTYKEGKFTGPNLELELPIIFGLTGKLQPYLNIYALNGLLDFNPPITPFASIEFLKARQLLPGKFDVNVLRTATPESLGEMIPENLDAAPTAKTDEPSFSGAPSVLEVRPKPPGNVGSKPGGKSDTLPTAPINLQSLIAKIGTGLPLERLEKLVASFGTLADKFGITGGIEKVLEWLDSYGLLAPLRKGVAVIDRFIEYVAAEVDLSITKLYDLFKLAPDEEGGEAQQPNLSVGDLRSDSTVLLLGQSRIWIDVPVAEGTQKGRITKNRLEEHGIVLMRDQPAPSFTFDSNKKLTGGLLTATLVIGDFGKVENVQLAVNADKNVAQTFTGGNFKPNEAKLPGMHDRTTDGKLNNTQVYLTQVALDSKAPPPPIENPMPGQSEKLPAAGDIDLSFRKDDKEWVLDGQGIKYGNVAFKVVLLKYSKNEKGEVSASGKATVVIDNLGRAAATVDIVAGEFKRLEFVVSSVRKSYSLGGGSDSSSEAPLDPTSETPVEQSSSPERAPSGGGGPTISGYFSGGFVILAQKLQDFNVAVDAQFIHSSVNKGKPVEMVGAVKTDTSLKPQFKLLLKTAPVSLMEGLASVEKLQVDYDGRNGKLEAAGKALLTFPGKDPSQESLEQSNGSKSVSPPITSGGDVPLPVSVEAPKGPGTVAADLLYKEGVTKLALKATNIGNQYLALDDINVAHTHSKGWELGAKATIKGIQGFDQIKAHAYYQAGKIGFRFEKTDTAEPKAIPGIQMTAGLSTLEYNLKQKTFSGEGNLGLAFPVAGTPTSATGFFRIQDSHMTGFGAQVATYVKVPTLRPLFQGLVSGEILYADGKLSGEIKGNLEALQRAESSESGSKTSNKESSSPTKTGRVRFSLRVDENGPTGSITQDGKLELGGGMVVLEDVNLRMERVPNVKATAAKLNKLGGKLSDLGQDGSSIERQNGVSGSGKIKADVGDAGGGSLNLQYADGEFKESRGYFRLGPAPDKNAKPGLAGDITTSFSTKHGFQVEKGSLTANITPGLQATGELERQGGGAVENGLAASLEMKANFFKEGSFKKSLFKSVVRPVFPMIPGLFSIYGEAGADLDIEYGVSPIYVEGAVKLANISLKDKSFESAFVHIKKAKSEEQGKQSGALYAKFKGKPYLGLGAAAFSPTVAGVAGGMSMPVTAEAKLDPTLDARLLYDKNGKLKGRFTLDLPLAMGVKVAVTPYIRGTALAGLLDLTWEPSKPLRQVDLLKPRVIYNRTLDFGNLNDAEKDPEDLAPSTVEEAKPADPKLAAAQQVGGEAEEPAPVPEVKTKSGDADPTDEMSKTGPFDFASIKSTIYQGYQATIKKVTAIYKNVKEVAGKVATLAGKAVGAVGSGIQSVAGSVGTAITDVASWIYSIWGDEGDTATKTALKEVDESEDIGEIPQIEALRPFRTFNWETYRQQDEFRRSMDRFEYQQQQFRRMQENRQFFAQQQKFKQVPFRQPTFRQPTFRSGRALTKNLFG